MLFNCARWLQGGMSIYLYRDFYHLGQNSRIPHLCVEKRGDLSPWLDPRPLGWGALAGKAEIFGRSPPPLPFGTRVRDCPPAEEPVAAFFAGRGLAGSSSELSSWIGLFALTVCISISSFTSLSRSFSWVEVIAMVDCTDFSDDMMSVPFWLELADVCDWDGVLFCLMASRRFKQSSIVRDKHSSSDLKWLGCVMVLLQGCDLVVDAYAFLDGSLTGGSTRFLASWNGMFSSYLICRIFFSIFHLGHDLKYAGWLPLPFAQCGSFSQSLSSWFSYHIWHIFVSCCKIVCCVHRLDNESIFGDLGHIPLYFLSGIQLWFSMELFVHGLLKCMSLPESVDHLFCVSFVPPSRFTTPCDSSSSFISSSSIPASSLQNKTQRE